MIRVQHQIPKLVFDLDLDIWQSEHDCGVRHHMPNVKWVQVGLQMADRGTDGRKFTAQKYIYIWPPTI